MALSCLASPSTGLFKKVTLSYPVCVLCRSASGTELMCCSWDGTVAYFDFSVEEIGKPMSTEEKVCHCNV